MIVDSKLTFHGHLVIIFTKVRKAIGLLRKPNSILPRVALVTVFKAFVQPHPGYDDVLYHQVFSSAFHNKVDQFSTVYV